MSGRAIGMIAVGLAFAAASALQARPLGAQTPPPGPATRSALSGEVLDAATGTPLAGATVTLRAIPADEAGEAASRPEPAPGPEAPLAGEDERVVVTDASGMYRFEGLRPGAYALEVSRLGFRAALLRVEIRPPREGQQSREARVAVGLELEPIALEPVTVPGPPAAPYDRDLSSGATGLDQSLATRLRQRLYLGSDTRSLSHAELLAAVTLGESDLFRALQRLPGVSTRDEWTAELWLRGSDWDHTRVYFDGLPLFNPVHGGGVLSGVNSDAVGAVYLHPGVRPARLGEGATALELRSRPAGGHGDVRGFGELSLASMRLAMDRRIAGGRGGWMVAARRTYLDWLTSALGQALGADDVAIPYRFTDLTARVDHPLGDDAALEVSGLWEADRLTGDIPDVLHGSRVAWGNLSLQATAATRHGDLRARHTVGYTGYGVEVDSIPEGDQPFDAGSAGAIDHALRYWLARGELAPARARPAWSAGYEVVHQRVRARGETPPMYLQFRTTAEDTIAMREALTTVAAWVDRRWTAGRLELDAGLRVEAGTEVRNGGALRLSPRVLARLRPAQRLAITAAAGRAYQYTQMLTPIGYFRADFPSGHLWLMAGDDAPALRADIASLGGELWLGEAWLASLTGYVRRADGVILPDPRPGITMDRPLFVAVEERGRGVEAGVRRLKGRITGSAAYTLAGTEQRLDDLVFPARSDRRHIVDLTALARITGALRLGAAFTFATGAPYTRVTFLDVDENGHPVGVLGRPNEQRAPSYASLDLMLDWTHRFRAWSLGAFLQLRNALDHDNTASYERTIPYCASGMYDQGPEGVTCLPGNTPPEVRDEFLFGLPRMPLIGLRVEF